MPLACKQDQEKTWQFKVTAYILNTPHISHCRKKEKGAKTRLEWLKVLAPFQTMPQINIGEPSTVINQAMEHHGEILFLLIKLQDLGVGGEMGQFSIT